MEYESKVEYSNPIESKDAWSKGQFIGTDISERKRRKEKRDERFGFYNWPNDEFLIPDSRGKN